MLAKEKQVVKNEKRQSVDNRPYGHNQYVIDKNLYPKGTRIVGKWLGR